MTDHIFAPFRPTESFEHTEHRRAREQRIVRRNIGSSLYDDFRPQRPRPLKPLYPAWVKA